MSLVGKNSLYGGHLEKNMLEYCIPDAQYVKSYTQIKGNRD